jgi:predicted HicB family RNase H-like nuclease
MMEYKGYLGRVEFDDDANLFHGEVIGTRDVITFQGTTVAQLRSAFRESIDDYLDFCKQRGEEPEKPYSGQFLARISPDLHRQISLAALAADKSLNAWVAEMLESAASGTKLPAAAQRSGKRATPKKRRQAG